MDIKKLNEEINNNLNGHEAQAKGAFGYTLNTGDKVIFVKAAYRGGIDKIAYGEIIDINKFDISIKDVSTGRTNHCARNHVISIKGIKENM